MSIRPRSLLTLAFGVALLAGLIGLRLADPFPVQIARETAFDTFQQLAPREALDLPVRVVDIDEASLAELGQWPWSRDVFAQLTERLTALGAAAIGYDVLFPEPDRLSPSRLLAAAADPLTARDFDAEFAAALAESPAILGFSVSAASPVLPDRARAGFAISGADPLAAVPLMPGAVLPLPSLAEAAPGLGGLSLNADDSVSVVRRLPLLWSNGSGLFPTLSVEALRIAMGVSTLVVMAETEGPGFVEALRIGDLQVPTTAQGEFWLHYREPDPDLYVSARAVLADDFAGLADRIAGHIVLVGSSASGLLDIRGTPLGANVPGVSIHAQAIEQMLTGRFLSRADWVLGAELLAIGVVGATVTTAVLAAGPLVGLLIALCTMVIATALCWAAFTQWGVLLDPSFPLLAALLVYTAMVFLRFFTTDADKRQIRNAFGHYVAPALLVEIERNGDRLKLGGEVRPLTVMFADIRNFTPLSESLAPPRLLGVLNTLFGALGQEITRQFGTIDKFMGDAVMAFWNAPVDVSDHPTRACIAALGMRARLAALNSGDGFGLRADDHPTPRIAIGIGIATGEALVGNMGLETRFDYSCVGDTVNLAARVEEACKTVAYDIVVVEATRRAAPELAFLEAGSIALKGKSERQPIHLLVGDALMRRRPDFIALSRQHEILLSRLRSGDDPSAEITRCSGLASAFDARLPAFYSAIARRQGDFLATETEGTRVPLPA
ncbi:adenylate/guanylate cyclase domain-containing protein [Arsenicitalea aurantiaca]|uniref:Adenylate/guanylate cyclase domain-containing protein n=1 Tax=Arsenicitalea aurantiaca TaxID=1783274 RepID=A0A433XBA4_9HYPH|nr:adenylate/guanylate cyclase domain-containing protein [Arsenicitalea aurantiaca]RUT31342.1 adenylate/guanylate cyclase domain-containing protein [Arsenicitalea aurantiaca]